MAPPWKVRRDWRRPGESGMTGHMPVIDFLVCGAGIAGASIAAELAPAGSVTVIEQEDIAGYHTTGRSAALYIPSYGNPVIRGLTAASRAFFDAPPVGFTDHPILTPRGCLHIADAARTDQLEALAVELSSTGVEVQRISGEAARAMVAVLRPEAVAAGVWEPGAADIDVAALHGGYQRLARQRGAVFRLSAGLKALERAGDVWRARLADGETLEARTLVNAAGAWGDIVAGLAGARPVGLQPKRRTAMILEPPPGFDIARWPAVIDVEEHFYFKPEAGMILATPADETPSEPVDAAPDEMDIAICIDRLQTAADIPVRRVVRSWAGLRTFAPDRTPVFGPDPEVPGFFWYVGQGGYGMQMAPAAAVLGAALARGDSVPEETAAAVSPARFAAGG